MDRTKLPYRKTSDCFLFYKGKIVAKDFGYYIGFPGGGIDKGETPVEAARREIKEEIGANVSKLRLLGHIKWDWHPEWANNDKRKKRYAKYRGEDVYLFIGKIDNFEKPTSDEGDDWTPEFMKTKKLIKKLQEYGKKDPPNMDNYRQAQLIILNLLKKAE